MSKLTHIDAKGQARMVDVSGKPTTERTATAQAFVRMQPETLAVIAAGEAPKGDVLAAARIAGIMAAKKTSELIPLCHPLPITGVVLECLPEEEPAGIRCIATVKVSGQTGVEMEALTAVSVAALTIYDMMKAVERGMTITDVELTSKEGGASGVYRAAAAPTAPRRSASASPARKLKPREVMSEVALRTPPVDHNARREAFRRFMNARGLTAHAWAKDAGLPVGSIYSFLHGRTHMLTKVEEEKLAAAAHVAVEDLYRG